MLLVRHRARGDVRVPQVRRPREEPTRVEVEVLLRVGARRCPGDDSRNGTYARSASADVSSRLLSMRRAPRRVPVAVPAVAVMPGAMLGGVGCRPGAPVPGRADGLR